MKSGGEGLSKPQVCQYCKFTTMKDEPFPVLENEHVMVILVWTHATFVSVCLRVDYIVFFDLDRYNGTFCMYSGKTYIQHKPWVV